MCVIFQVVQDGVCYALRRVDNTKVSPKVVQAVKTVKFKYICCISIRKFYCATHE
jgi:hypothetical protein